MSMTLADLILSELAATGGGLNSVELAHRIGEDPGIVLAEVKRLVAEGYLRMEPPSED